MASAEVMSGTPLAEALQNAVQPKLAENGWSSGAGDDSALSEYIILMLANGKTQEQIASELANDLLGLGPEDPSPMQFAQWLFEQVTILNSQLNGGPPPQQVTHDQVEQNGTTMTEDTTMGSAIDTAGANAVPTGPNSMRTNSAGAQRGRDRRMAGQLRSTLERNNDGGMHKIRGAASRISRDPPSGPRGSAATKMKGMMGGVGRGGQPMNAQAMASMAQDVTPQNQMALYQMLEEQSRMMAQLLASGGQAPAVNPRFFNKQGGGQGGKSLFERVDNRSRQNGHNAQRPPKPAASNGDAMDTVTEDGTTKKAQSEIPCKFQTQCTSPTCPYAHQSSAAPPGVSIDVTDICSYGAACTNRKCVASHPSPAQKRQYLSSTVDCKFYPNCTNPSCPFRHPSTPPCRNGADCPDKDSGCRFSHSSILCRYNPCLNPHCVFKHAEGQRQLDGAAAGQQHVSQRKFTTGDGQAQEELVLPGSGMDVDALQQQQGQGQASQGSLDEVVVERSSDVKDVVA